MTAMATALGGVHTALRGEPQGDDSGRQVPSEPQCAIHLNHL